MQEPTAGFFKISAPFFDKALKTHHKPLIFSNPPAFPHYQLRLFETQGLFPQQPLRFDLISLRKQAIFLDVSHVPRLFPNFSLMSDEDLRVSKEIFEGNAQFFYARSEILAQKLEFAQAKAQLLEGTAQNDRFAVLALIRVLCEPALAERFELKRDFSRVCELFLQYFKEFGVFDCEIPGQESIYPLELFYIYADCFPAFLDELHLRALKEPLFSLLLQKDWKKSRTYSFLREIDEKYADSPVLLGDLRDPRLFGIDYETDFNEMQQFYCKGLRKNSLCWLKLASLSESFLRTDSKKPANQRISADSRKKLLKNIETAYKHVGVSSPNSRETLWLRCRNSLNLEDYRGCARFGDEFSLKSYYQVLRLQEKLEKLAKNSQKLSEIRQEKFIVAQKLGKIEEREALGLCFEKGVGTERDFSKAFAIYRESLKNSLSSGRENQAICYRLGCLLDTSKENIKEFAEFFLQSAYFLLFSRLNDADLVGFCQLAKIYAKARGIPEDVPHAVRIYEAIARVLASKPEKTFEDMLLSRFVELKLKKMRKNKENSTENAKEFRELRDFLAQERKNSAKLAEKSRFSRVFANNGSLTGEILATLAQITEKVKGIWENSSGNLEEMLTFPFEKSRSSVIGSLKAREITGNSKENSEIPKLRLQNKENSLKIEENAESDAENLRISLKNTLSQHVHCFEREEILLNVEESVAIGAKHKLFPAKLQRNGQIFMVKEEIFKELDDWQGKLAGFYERIEGYLRLQSPFLVNIVGFVVEQEGDCVKLLLLYESFLETLTGFLAQHAGTSPDLPRKYFNWIVLLLDSFHKSGYLLAYLTEHSFVMTQTLSIKLLDLDYSLLHKASPPKSTAIFDPSKLRELFSLSRSYIPPELLFGLVKNNKAILSTGSAVWSLGVLGFWLFTGKNLFEGVQVRSYEDFKEFYNQEKLAQKLDSLTSSATLSDSAQLLKRFLVMNQQDRTNVQLSSISEPLISENYLFLQRFLHANFANPANAAQEQEIFLANAEYFRGTCANKLPHGVCQLVSRAYSMKSEFSQGKLQGKGEVLNSEAGCVLELSDKADKIAKNSKACTLRKLSFVDFQEISLNCSDFCMDLDESLFKKLTDPALFPATAKLLPFVPQSFGSFKELDEAFSWELVVKFLLSLKNFNKTSANPSFSADSCAIYSVLNAENVIAELFLYKCDFSNPHVLIFDEKISKKLVFFASFFAVGLFLTATRPTAQTLGSFSRNLPGIKYIFPGTKEIGQFLELSLQKGARIREFSVVETVDLSRPVHLYRYWDTRSGRRFEGLAANARKSFEGTETFPSGCVYEGGYLLDIFSGKGALRDAEGKLLYKGFFQEGKPSWGVYFAEKARRFEGEFVQIAGFCEETGFSIEKPEDFAENFAVRGVYWTPGEKIAAVFGEIPIKHCALEELSSGFYKILYDSGNEYRGFLSNGKKSGPGTYIIKRGGEEYVKIMGNWRADTVRAVIFWDSANGFEKSVGTFAYNDAGNYNMRGFGLLFFKNGNRYVGSFADNKLCGYGEFEQKAKDLRKVYRGEFKESLRNGFGFLQDFNERNEEIANFNGFFVKNKKNGYGEMRNAGKSKIFQGLFAENCASFGFLTHESHEFVEKTLSKIVKTQGNSGELEAIGFGIAYLRDGRTIEGDISNILADIRQELVVRMAISKGNPEKIFEGTVKNLKPHGFGEMYVRGRLLYSGEFFEGKFQGIGRLRIGDEKEFVGSFYRGFREGFGIERDVLSGKVVFKGFWKDGRRESRGVRENRVFFVGKTDVLIDL